MPDFYYAKVIDNNDTLKEGRVQIYVEHLMKDFTPSLYPWAKQSTSFIGGASTYGSSLIPEINSLVWVWFEDETFFKKPYYVADVHLETFHPHGLFEALVKTNITGFTSAYPNVKYLYLPNGICIAVSTDLVNKELVIYHSSGTYFFIDKTGKVFLKAGTTSLEKMVLGETLKTVLENLIDAITGATFGSHPLDVATPFAAVKTSLSTILSSQIKNN